MHIKLTKDKELNLRSFRKDLHLNQHAPRESLLLQRVDVYIECCIKGSVRIMTTINFKLTASLEIFSHSSLDEN